jgi:hypothetical protein
MNTNTQSNVATIEIALPSNGILYPTDSLLSKGKLNVRYMTGRDEDIFANPTFIKNNDVLFQLIKSLVVDKDFNPYDLVMSDMVYLIVAIRIMSLGDTITFKDVQCPKCGEIEPIVTISLTNIKENPPKFMPDSNNTNLFSLKLPDSNKVVTLKVVTGKDIKELDANIKKAKASNLSRLFTLVTSSPLVSVDDKPIENMGDRLNFIDNLSLRDMRAIRQHIVDISGATEGNIPHVCTHCGHESEIKISLDETFFFPEL